MKKFTLVLGAPRSGTSIVSSIIEQLGLKFEITSENTLDGFYKVNHSFKQRRDIHFFLLGLKLFYMEKYTKPISLDIFKTITADVIKEPYLLFILDQIRDLVLNIVFVIRNPNDVIASQRVVAHDNNGDCTNLNISMWNKYQKVFIESVRDIPYIVVNYDNMVANPSTTIENLKKFFGKDDCIIDTSSIRFNNTCKNIILSADSMYLYKNLSLNIKIKTIPPIDLTTNAQCFCKSGKKYKKCCSIFPIPV
jgi:hypothetical protein